MDFHIIEIKMKMCVNRTPIVFEDSKQNAAKTTTKRKKKKTKQKKRGIVFKRIKDVKRNKEMHKRHKFKGIK